MNKEASLSQDQSASLDSQLLTKTHIDLLVDCLVRGCSDLPFDDEMTLLGPSDRDWAGSILTAENVQSHVYSQLWDENNQKNCPHDNQEADALGELFTKMCSSLLTQVEYLDSDVLLWVSDYSFKQPAKQMTVLQALALCHHWEQFTGDHLIYAQEQTPNSMEAHSMIDSLQRMLVRYSGKSQLAIDSPEHFTL